MQNQPGYTFLVRYLDKVLNNLDKGKFVRLQINAQILEKYGEVKKTNLI